MLIEIILFGVTALLTYILYKLAKVDRSYFEKRNLKYIPQLSGWFGFFRIIFNSMTATELASQTYNAFANEPIYGSIDAFGYSYIVRDPEIIKKIGIKDFDNFENHNTFVDESIDKIWGNSLFLMKGQKWRQMRATLSPAFTGSKMRQMFNIVLERADVVVKHFKQLSAANKKVNVEMKDFFTRYTNDVIAACAFGLQIDSFAEPNNEFYLDAKNISSFVKPFFMVKIILFMFAPSLARMFNISLVDGDKFRRLVIDTMEYRAKNKIFRPDMINIMIKIREGSLNHQIENKSNESQEGFATVQESDVGKVTVNRIWNDDEIVAQCFIFLIAGFETTATMLTFAAYELVANQDIQQRLYEEIVEVNEKRNGKEIDYDTLQKMKYLDQFVSEVLRKWPPALSSDRICNKTHMYDDGDKLKFNVEKGSIFMFQTYGIHNDPQYYPNPEKFDPERFNDENKDKIQPGTYLPFGIGPRNCIGSRFALMEIKAILYSLLLNFTFEPNEKTDIPLKLQNSPFVFAMENGMNLELKPRLK